MVAALDRLCRQAERAVATNKVLLKVSAEQLPRVRALAEGQFADKSIVGIE